MESQKASKDTAAVYEPTKLWYLQSPTEKTGLIRTKPNPGRTQRNETK